MDDKLYEVLSKRMDTFETDLKSTKADVSQLITDVAVVKTDISEMKKTVDKIDGYFLAQMQLPQKRWNLVVDTAIAAVVSGLISFVAAIKMFK